MICPQDRSPLTRRDDEFECERGHRFPIVAGVPVLVSPELEPTQPGYWSTPEEQARITADGAQAGDGVLDPYVAKLLVGTHGNLYRGAAVTRYPIPPFPLEPADARRLLDVGCNWGRWSLAAAERGFEVVGVDPSIEATAAAVRIARSRGAAVEYVAADARRLPFEEGSFDVVFSYSVLQHFSRTSVEQTIGELARVLVPGGLALVQMANAFGLRSIYHQVRAGFREADGFEIRYWRPRDLRRAFWRIGDVTLSADGFFTLNPQVSDLDLLAPRARAVVRTSSALQALSRRFPPLAAAADSLWVRAVKR